MLSDVLFDAIEEIEHYQAEFADIYDELKPDIERVKSEMRSLQHKLDASPNTPPGDGAYLHPFEKKN